MPSDPPAARKARMEVYQRLLSELDANGQKLSEQISEIDLTDPEDARVLMPEQGADILAHFGQDHFLERYQLYKAHIAEWRQQYPQLARSTCATTSRSSWRWLPAQTWPQTAADEASRGRIEALTCEALPAADAASAQTGNRQVRQSRAKSQVESRQQSRQQHSATPQTVHQAVEANACQGQEARAAPTHRAATQPGKRPPQTARRPLPGWVSERTMSQKHDNIIVALDIGSSWTRVLVAESMKARCVIAATASRPRRGCAKA